MIPKISLIVCTHNPRHDYLTRVISALRGQTLSLDTWELIVVDNCSSTPVDGQFDFSWHPDARAIREEKLGLTNARLRGIHDARANLLVFVDDDNVLDANYLALALKISMEYPHLGAWSGSCKAEFEVEPDGWARKYTRQLCVTELDRDYWCNFPFANHAMPSGAGLCLRADAAKEYVALHRRGLRPVLLDRAGESLASGGDIDIALTCAHIGYGMGIFRQLTLTHLIPRFRLQKSYLLKLTEALAFTSAIIEFYHPAASTPPGSPLKTKVANLLRLMLLPKVDRAFFRAHLRGLQSGRMATETLRRNDDPLNTPASRLAKLGSKPHTHV